MLLAFFFSIFTAYANDPLALLSDSNLRQSVSKAQEDEIIRRSGLGATECSELLADLPFANNTTTPLHTALGTIQRMTLFLRQLPIDCLNQLAQNLALSNNPASQRVAEELLSFRPERSISNKTNYCSDSASGLEEILGLNQAFTRIQRCAPLAQGRWKTVSGTSSSGIPYNYGLIQQAPNEFKAVLNVEFKGTNDNVTGAMLLERSRVCLNSIKDSLQGPNGEKLSISLLTPTELRAVPQNLRPKKTTISVEPANARSHSKAYASSIECPTILHEVLHLLGLCDEYPGEGDNYPCRAVGARDSVMRNQWLTFGSSVPENFRCECKTPECREALNDPKKRDLVLKPNFYDVIPWQFRNSFCEFDPGFFRKDITSSTALPPAYNAQLESSTALRIISALNPSPTNYDEAEMICRCPVEDLQCQNLLASFEQPSPLLKPLSCPSPTEFLSARVGEVPSQDRFRDNVLEFHRPAIRSSLLEPHHFNRIMAGACDEKITNYEECAQFAYKSSAQSCQSVPARCLRSTNWGNQ